MNAAARLYVRPFCKVRHQACPTAPPRWRQLRRRANVYGRYPEGACSPCLLERGLMGREIQAIKISGEDRGKYRDKVRRSLEVFARMLR